MSQCMIEEELTARGYTYRQTENTERTGKHEIWHGRRYIGLMSAHEAAAFVEALREADKVSDEDLQAAADLYDQLHSFTYFRKEKLL